MRRNSTSSFAQPVGVTLQLPLHLPGLGVVVEQVVFQRLDGVVELLNGVELLRPPPRRGSRAPAPDCLCRGGRVVVPAANHVIDIEHRMGWFQFVTDGHHPGRSTKIETRAVSSRDSRSNRAPADPAGRIDVEERMAGVSTGLARALCSTTSSTACWSNPSSSLGQLVEQCGVRIEQIDPHPGRRGCADGPKDIREREILAIRTPSDHSLVRTVEASGWSPLVVTSARPGIPKLVVWTIRTSVLDLRATFAGTEPRRRPAIVLAHVSDDQQVGPHFVASSTSASTGAPDGASSTLTAPAARALGRVVQDVVDRAAPVSPCPHPSSMSAARVSSGFSR